MNDVQLSKVKKIATEVRTWAETNRTHPNLVEHFLSDLGGMCAIATAKLVTALKNGGLEARAVTNGSHCFAMVGDYIVDVTATQFGRERVFIRHERMIQLRPGEQDWWNVDIVLSSAKELREHQLEVGWEEAQVVPRWLA